ncbi:MAG: hypothetical protein M1828_003172 [Chrysothrix sp. TS-e1954]|nr:MAG: hypothetical protein M1828_003172 [Chrysothrix sp. TS-e1954]
MAVTRQKRKLTQDPERESDTDGDFVVGGDWRYSDRRPKRRRGGTASSATRRTRSAAHPASQIRSVGSDMEGSARKPRKRRQAAERDPPPDEDEHSKATSSTLDDSIESYGVAPAWTTLPYEILFSVFHQASDPLVDRAHNMPTASRRWLLHAATTCKAFAEPALAALYHNPPLCTLVEPHELLDTLQKDKPYIDYKTKIRHLELDSRDTLAYSSVGRGQINLLTLLQHMPQVTNIDITDATNRVPFRWWDNRGRWTYTDELFESLKHRTTPLKSWRWHGRSLNLASILVKDNTAVMKSLHQSRPFSRLRHLTVSRISLMSHKECTNCATSLFAESLQPLEELESLSLETLTCPDWSVLVKIPRPLARLSLINNWDLDTEALDAYLQKHGTALKVLTLKHNPSIDLSFLPKLKSLCPNLESLAVDMTCYSTAVSYHNAKPRFPACLKDDQIPTWPSKLRTLELLHIKQWSPTAAENLFNSLLQSAEALPDLREIVIKAILDASWRERARLRDTYIPLFDEVFRRFGDPLPDPIMASRRRYDIWRATDTAEGCLKLERKWLAAMEGVPVSELSKRYHYTESGRPLSSESSTSDAPAKESPHRRSKRARRKPKILEQYVDNDRLFKPETSDEDNDEDNDGSSSSKADQSADPQVRAAPRHVQGLCDVVDVMIDNSHPTENQFKEDDFMDSEASGDENWSDVGDLEDRTGYAW